MNLEVPKAPLYAIGLPEMHVTRPIEQYRDIAAQTENLRARVKLKNAIAEFGNYARS